MQTTKNSSYTVSQFNQLFKEMVDEIPLFQDVFIQGEITNLKYYQLGRQCYFNLSDGQSNLNCVLYDTFIKQLKFKPKNGDAVVARGKLKVFPKKGTVIFQVSYLAMAGEGTLKEDFERLKQQLLKEGIFNPERKKALPRFPEKIALITSYDSAAMWDFVTLSRQGAPHLDLIVIPAVVQGDLAPMSLFNGLEIAKKITDLDLVVMMRGGGSSEDLAGFNDETLVRAMAEFDCPIISAVGHEIDYSLTDFVADMRAATPTDAAKMITAPFIQFKRDLYYRLTTHLDTIKNKFNFFSEKTYDLLQRSDRQLQLQFDQKQKHIEGIFKRLEQANPLHKLRQGFSISRQEKTKKILKAIGHVEVGQIVETELEDGYVFSEVKKIINKK